MHDICSIAGSGEIFEGIKRHGPHNIYWCYRFERMVSDYGRTRTNQKDQEVTYSFHFARRFFTKICSYIWEDDDGLFPHQRALGKVHESLRVTSEHKKNHKLRDRRDFSCPHWHKDCVAIVSSQTIALELWDGMQSSVESYGCKDMVLSKGVGIGSTRRKSQSLGTSILTSLKKCWEGAGVLQDNNHPEHMSDTCTPLRAVVWRKQVYRPGDHVVVLLDNSTNRAAPNNWKAVIQSIFMHELIGRMGLFFEANWYKQKLTLHPRSGVGTWDRDEYSQFTVLDPKPLRHQGDNCRLVSRIVHKFFPVHRDSNEGALEVVAMEVGDTLQRELPQSIANCPPFPEVGDIMNTVEGKLCVVRDVLLPPGDELTVEGDPTLEDAANEESDCHNDTDDTPIAQTPETHIGTVNVSWLSGPRGDNQEYKASTRIDANLDFKTLLCRSSLDFQPIQFSQNVPVKWAIQST